jgi:hypothetical protein
MRKDIKDLRLWLWEKRLAKIYAEARNFSLVVAIKSLSRKIETF